MVFTDKLAIISVVNLVLLNSNNQDETKKEPTPPKQIPYSQRKKSSATGDAPGAAAANGAGGEGEPGEMFKMPKKKSVARKPLEKKEEETPAFAGMKLKKSERVQRKWDDDKMETVDLKHHEFEKEPLEEGVSFETKSFVTIMLIDVSNSNLPSNVIQISFIFTA